MTQQAPKHTPKSCDCPKCRQCCERNPGWMTPEEAAAAIKAGLASKLMRDWLEPCSEVGNERRIYLLAPASIGYEGADAPEFPDMDFISAMFSDWCKGRCVLLKNGRCTIHESGFKPIQCRLTFACDDTDSNEPSRPESNYAVAKLWQSVYGRQVIREWRAALGKATGGQP